MRLKEIEATDLPKNLVAATEMDTDWKLHKTYPKTTIPSKLFPELHLTLIDGGDGKTMFVYAFFKNQKRAIPLMQIQMYKYGRNSWVSQLSAVRKTAQGSGIGYKVYQILIREAGITLMSDKSQSQGARMLWAKLFRTPGITVYGFDPNAKDDEQFFQVHNLDQTGDLEGATRGLYTSFGVQYDLNKEKDKAAGPEKKELRKATNTRLVAVKSFK